MKIFYDVNVLLEALLESRKSAHVALTVLSRGEGATISPLSAHLYVHFGKKEKHTIKSLLEDLSSYRVAAMDEQTVRWAIKNRQDEDFEDALQVGCAVLNGCNRLVTFDKQLARRYGHVIDIQLLN